MNHVVTTGGAEKPVDGEAEKGKPGQKGISGRQHILGCEKGTKPRGMKLWVLSPTLPLPSCVTQRNSLNLSELQFPHLKVIIVRSTSQGYCEDLRKSVY